MVKLASGFPAIGMALRLNVRSISSSMGVLTRFCCWLRCAEGVESMFFNQRLSCCYWILHVLKPMGRVFGDGFRGHSSVYLRPQPIHAGFVWRLLADAQSPCLSSLQLLFSWPQAFGSFFATVESFNFSATSVWLFPGCSLPPVSLDFSCLLWFCCGIGSGLS